jgi:predicted double-glycine peptidase
MFISHCSPRQVLFSESVIKYIGVALKKYIIPVILMVIFAGFFSFQSFNRSPAPPTYKIDEFEKYIIAQPDSITCGPTCGTMLLNYYSKNVSLDEVKKESLTEWFRFDDGKNFGMTAPDALRVSLHKFGLKSRVRHGNVGQLKKYISEGKPVIVLLRSSNTTWHYCVAFAYDETTIRLGDPGSGHARSMTIETFVKCWKFTHDMHGQKCDFECVACGGKGRYMNLMQCDLCSGKGSLDPLVLALRAADIHSYTMIVPEKGK